ncbi:ubiquinone biosynthesis hydroxylase, UbiH/UbiF/VisC/COQ6 family protein [Orientia tsutsugamushi str. Gilliam]|uniref:2-polyprenyl-6-methoxyphenol 4-hydroxylase n=1 Tax=Orientia tsutsugamushi str. Gilliam TaxID=1359184 RepID=A0A0F3MDR7_ORITS|nr:FAD-dependent monooxygenase [Orientia tsutsugamushi]KJV53806.1 ubiquinone biosynthesis hydroxylase, UbiH/UbiF/VisC/COQ6 family protein [Orientia tsutsugamushi str. Gilliam]SPR03195.1 2-polyprenyl-6-methoxyphenol 4-hydroxylase [Orientia tsutsugamushi str. Gilliam]
MKKEEIIILGCGFNGMITALGLASYNIKSTIIEKKNLSNTNYLDTRTTALTQRSKSIFKNFNIWKDIEPYTSNINEVYVVDNKSTMMVHLNASKSEFDSIGHMIENSNLYVKLIELVQNNPLINVIDNTSYISIDSHQHSTAIDINTSSKIHCDLLIVCDGCNSIARTQYFEYFIDKEYHQSAIVLNVKHQKQHLGTAVEHFLPNGPFATLPLADQQVSSIVWVEKSNLATLYTQMDKKSLTNYVQDKFGWSLGKIEIITNPVLYPLKAKIAKQYYHNNVVLVGDTAHMIHPLAGQGLNQSIKDIDSLTDILHSRKSLGLEMTSSEFKLYQRDRFLDNYTMYLLTDNLNRLFSNNLPLLATARKISLGLLDKSVILKRMIMKYGMGSYSVSSKIINIANYIF